MNQTHRQTGPRLLERDAHRIVAHVATVDPGTGLPVIGDKALRELEKSPSPMRIFDLASLKFLAVNDAAVEFYGYSREEFLAISVRELRHPDEHKALENSLAEQAEYLRHRPPRRHVTKSGEVVVVEVVTQDVLFNGRRARLSLTMDLTGRLQAQELMWQRQEEFERLAENLPDLVARFDLSHRFVYVNSAVERLQGLPRHELIGRTQRELGMPDDLVAKFERSLDEAVEAGESHTLEFGVMTAGGECIFEAYHIPERDADGQIRTILCVARDITERKKVEEEARRQKNLLAAIIDNLPVGVFIRDADTLRYVMRNRFLEDLSGYAVDSSIGKSVYDVFPREQADRSVATDRQALASGKLVDIPEQEMLGKSGEPRIFHVRKVPLLDDRGCPQLLVGIADDITEHKHAERALRESEEKFRQLAENIHQVFWINTLAVDGNLYVSPAYEKIWGRSRESLRRDPNSWLTSVHPEDQLRVREALKGVAGGHHLDVEYRIVRPDGSLRWIRDRSYPMTRGDGTPLLCGLAEDVTDVKRAEQEKLTHAAHQRDALVREVHHRIKNSLQGVVGLLRQKIRKYPAVAPDIEEAIGQLQSLALVYGLQETRPDGLLSLAEITDAICSSAEKLIGGRVSREIERLSRQPACIAGTEAVSVAVALNELVFNALKHQPAQAGRKRAVVKVTEAQGSAEICISNRGQLPKGFDFSAGRSVGYGLGLVRTLLAPPGGKVAFNGGRDKVEVKLTLAPPLLAGPRKTHAK